MTRRLVVIGNGMAATRLVQRLVERDPARFAITVVGDEPHPAYNRIQLSPLLAGEKTAAQIPLLPAEWYTRHGVCLRSGEAVDEVDIQQRRLRIAETWLPWDELVFATGSRPFIPPLPGIDRPQVMPFRTGGRGTYSGDTRPGGGDWRWGAGGGSGGGAASSRRRGHSSASRQRINGAADRRFCRR